MPLGLDTAALFAAASRVDGFLFLSAPHLGELTVHVDHSPLDFYLVGFPRAPVVLLFVFLLVGVFLAAALGVVVLFLDDGLVLPGVGPEVLLLIKLLLALVRIQLTI